MGGGVKGMDAWMSIRVSARLELRISPGRGVTGTTPAMHSFCFEEAPTYMNATTQISGTGKLPIWRYDVVYWTPLMQHGRFLRPLARLGRKIVFHIPCFGVRGVPPRRVDKDYLSSYTLARSTNIPEMASGVQQIPLHDPPPIKPCTYTCVHSGRVAGCVSRPFFIAPQNIPPNRISYKIWDGKRPIIVSSGIGCLEVTLVIGKTYLLYGSSPISMIEFLIPRGATPDCVAFPIYRKGGEVFGTIWTREKCEDTTLASMASSAQSLVQTRKRPHSIPGRLSECMFLLPTLGTASCSSLQASGKVDRKLVLRLLERSIVDNEVHLCVVTADGVTEDTKSYTAGHAVAVALAPCGWMGRQGADP
ncbi:uncharacterized protein BO96DRAFT_476988 [Aspergillus niger CBS 101883]|uniref:uncharacterized protein n=1 Tax=Aspergillus lacticoffeatus (strain CBS 101883) TaxID=1450533 RepID=UPI000D7F0F9E|nr:uncharacterized protein BO96DRAFT_476988 [Aspergillus niger CBS 101883]PYH55292.1 hypothetical protein BO96DRAFT_476988 [Aspergillus niger CBS 101883]